MKNNRLVYILIILIAAWLGFISHEVFSRKEGGSDNIINHYDVSGFSTDFTKIIDEVDPAVVTVNGDGNISSGFIYAQKNDDVYIVTAYHGISSANNITITFASTYSQKGELIGHDNFADLAVIKVTTPYEMKTLKIGDANLLKKGEYVISIGTPVSSDYASSVELGMISLKNVTVENTITVEEERYTYYLNLIELSSNLQAGYSGSPLINMNGELIGMNTMNVVSNLSFAVTSNEVQRVADRLINNEQITRNNLGIKGSFVSEMYNYEKSNLNISIDTLSGIYVLRCKEGSLAYEAGIRNGDIVLSISGIEIKDLNDFLDAIYANEQDDIVFEYLHNSERFLSGVKRD